MSLFNGGSGRELSSVTQNILDIWYLPVYGISKAATFSNKLVNMKEILMRSLWEHFEGKPDFPHSLVKTQPLDCSGYPSHMTLAN